MILHQQVAIVGGDQFGHVALAAAHGYQALQALAQAVGALHGLGVAGAHAGLARADQLVYPAFTEDLAHRAQHLHRHLGVHVGKARMAGLRQPPYLGGPAAAGRTRFGVHQAFDLQARHLLAHRLGRHVQHLGDGRDALRAARLERHENALGRLVRNPVRADRGGLIGHGGWASQGLAGRAAVRAERAGAAASVFQPPPRAL
ncbi:Uncharacterised protein [Bordetella pertussis]|nr:Uncharacterised protein [Bordetella pertussis]